jgi:P-type E1-E2 ATPase
VLLSGDRDDVVMAVAQQCGITEAHAGLSPRDKFNVVQKLQADGARVVMVGMG